MGCCDNMMTKKEHDERLAGKCSECGADVDEDGEVIEFDHCGFSPQICGRCGYRPCQGYC